MVVVLLDSIPAAPSTASSLAPGFRFHPTDEELVRYYLRRKICRKPFKFDAISDVDVYKVEPWDLPGLSRLKSRDLEWYFFSVLDKKYGNGSRTNRATVKGYWKTTGKDRSVYHRSQLVGMKKTLVYHIGRAPRGERTNWVMHEYRLIDQELEKAGFAQDAFVLCRIFYKSGAGPKNGEKYGAPFVEEEWEDDELVMVPKQEFAEEIPVDDDDVYLDANDIEQILGSDTPAQDGVISDNLSAEMIDNHQNLLTDQPAADIEDGLKLFDLPVENEFDPNPVKHEYINETSNSLDYEEDYLLDEPVFDASSGDFQFDGNSFFEADDLKIDIKTEPGHDMFNGYSSFLNPDMDNLECTFDSLENENILANSSLALKNEETHQLSDVSEQFFEMQNNDLAIGNFEGTDVNGASTSNQVHQDSTTSNMEGTHESSQQLVEDQNNDFTPFYKKEDADLSTDFAFPFLQRASCMLGNISSPPAFASEFPSKYMASASQASTSVRVTTGIIRIRNVSFTGGKLDCSLAKNGHLDIVLSFGLERNDVIPTNSHEIDMLNSQMANSSLSRSWFYCMFLWIMVLSLSFKISSLVSPRSFMS